MKIRKIHLLIILFIFLGACKLPSLAQNDPSADPVPTNVPAVDETTPTDENATNYSKYHIAAWYGDIIRGPETISSAATQLNLWPEGSGELLLTGSTGDVETQLLNLANSNNGSRRAHVWGEMTCPENDPINCRIVVSYVYPEGNFEPIGLESIEVLEGLIFSGPPQPGSGGTDYFATSAFAEMYFIEYGIHGVDQEINTLIDSYRDTGQVVLVTGTIIAGLPDWNSSQFLVTAIEPVLNPLLMIAPQPIWLQPYYGWQTYINVDFGYQFDYPPGAMITEEGVSSYPTADLPSGMQPSEYRLQLQQTYGDKICVSLNYFHGYITISAPINTQFAYTLCGRTGVGVGTMTDKTEQLTINSIIEIAEGFEFYGGSDILDDHNETFVIYLADNTRIEYGAGTDLISTYTDYLSNAKESIILIVESYRPYP